MNYVPRVLAAAEDAVFRFYLPLARSLAAGAASPAPDREGLEQAAELGLAQAVLGWRGSDPAGFERYAGYVVTARLQQFPAAPRKADPASVLPTLAPPLGCDHRAPPGAHTEIADDQ